MQDLEHQSEQVLRQKSISSMLKNINNNIVRTERPKIGGRRVISNLMKNLKLRDRQRAKASSIMSNYCTNNVVPSVRVKNQSVPKQRYTSQ